MTVELSEVIRILQMQEEILQFSHFTNGDAWELGNILVKEAARRDMTAVINIRLNNGFDVFQYGFDGTTLYNQKNIDKKFRTVMTMEQSTLLLNMLMQETEESLPDIFDKPAEYTMFGGDFPIRVEEVGVVGVISVSNLEHVAAHDLIVKCVGKYLHVDEVPRIRSVS